jgi:capsular polysaccharide biosynthesis protein
MKPRVLCEAKEFKRSPPEMMYGQPQQIAIFKEALNQRYSEEDLTTFSTKNITLKTLKNIVVHGEIPQIRQVSEDQLKRFKEYVPLAAVLVQKWGYGYFHFLVEVLPKILRMNELHKRIPILIDFNTVFIKQALEYFEITNPIIPYNNNAMFFPVKEAVHITETMSGNPTPNDISMIRNKLEISTQLPKVNIIIYRKELQRSIINFDKLLTQLKTQTPSEEWVVFDRLPFKETVELFSRAKMIVGAHGAGLTNMIFAPNKIPVIELSPSDEVNLCYWHLSWILENDHRLVASHITKNQEIDAPIDEILSIIKTIN